MKPCYRAQKAFAASALSLIACVASMAAAHAQTPGAGGLLVNGVDNDPANRIWNCETNRATFGDEGTDKSRCVTFRYQVPAGGVRSAVLHLSIRSFDPSTDAVVIGVNTMFPSCSWATGPMPCVMVHGGPLPANARALAIDLFNVARAPNVTNNTAEAQQAVTVQLNTGVVHMMLQDDTALYCAQLVINGGTGQPLCTGAGPTTTAGGAPTTPPGGSPPPPPPAGKPTGSNLPLPPFGTPEPTANVPGMTLQGGQRRVVAGATVRVPFYLINGANVSNMNFEVIYNIDVVRAGDLIPTQGVLDKSTPIANPKVGGIVRAAFAQTSGIPAPGTGVVLTLPFRATGKPGDSTRLHLVVTTINTLDGRVPTIHRIPGEIVITDANGRIPGQPGTGGGGTGGGPGTGSGPGAGGPGAGGGPGMGGGPGTGGPGAGGGPGGPGSGGPGTAGTGPGGGDCDGDGRLTVLDARCALEMSVQLTPVRLVLDMDSSKDVTSRDAVIILQRAISK